MPYFIIYGKRKWRKSLLYERQGLINRRLAGLNERLKLADRKQDSNHRAVSPNKGEHLRGGDSAWGHPNVKSVKNLHVDPISRLTKTFGLKAEARGRGENLGYRKEEEHPVTSGVKLASAPEKLFGDLVRLVRLKCVTATHIHLIHMNYLIKLYFSFCYIKKSKHIFTKLLWISDLKTTFCQH